VFLALNLACDEKHLADFCNFSSLKVLFRLGNPAHINMIKASLTADPATVLLRIPRTFLVAVFFRDALLRHFIENETLRNIIFFSVC